MNPEQWSHDIAELSAEALRDARLIAAEDLEKVKEIVAEEILIRLKLGDYPAPDSI